MSTRWRQGDLVAPEHIHELGLPNTSAPALQRLVVASHSCDIAADKTSEPHVELLIAETVDAKQARDTSE